MRFWDASAILPLLVTESATQAATALYESDAGMLTWWATEVECVSALARREREGSLEARGMQRAAERLALLAAVWTEIQPAIRIRQAAARLLRLHPLRPADAFQLAAAIAAADDDRQSLPFVTLDDRLARAAEREGFPVVEPA